MPVAIYLDAPASFARSNHLSNLLVDGNKVRCGALKSCCVDAHIGATCGQCCAQQFHVLTMKVTTQENDPVGARDLLRKFTQELGIGDFLVECSDPAPETYQILRVGFS